MTDPIMETTPMRIAHARPRLTPLPIALLACLAWCVGSADAKPIKHQITGLFSAEREQDLRETFAKIPEIKLVSVDFKNAEAILDYDPEKVFSKVKPEVALQRLNDLVRNASSHTMGVKPLCATPRDKLMVVEIPIAGLDCKACCLVAYEAIYQIDGVERATASFRECRVTALIDPARTDRARLEAALVKRGVSLKAP
jgi:copper chaperone CopZ